MGGAETGFGDGAVGSLLRAALGDPEAAWSLGSFGALATFRRDRDEAVAPPEGGRCGAVTGRGAIALAPPPGLRPLAYETAFATGWSHAVALCLPEADCAMAGRGVLTELGPDGGAARGRDRGGILFDLGLGLRAADACIRTADPALLAALRAGVGRALFAAGNPLGDLLAAAGPHRVFVTRVGRIEVFGPVAEPDPTAPRTHILPQILRARRTHAATAPIPAGLVPCGALHPPHPCKDALGRTIPFRRVRHDAFQRLLDAFGDPALVAAKRAAEAGRDFSPGPGTNRRYLRAAQRAAAVQAPHLHGADAGAASLSHDA
ncbi:DUF6925 family protein [Methylobacterium sp. J-076]|uniref:DUF6925 family protein n=1 Tax=Methylobacterium sp. J-076 TaxID=2836655 RepID=UPI001FBAB481|nr:hypothetical protein [Methylobacterium sp. J-076]MCJ2013109.1 hypothetical protein [Methylobacterium sp. J-076]